MKRLWGDQFYNPKEKKWTKTAVEGSVRGFCQFVLDPIFKVREGEGEREGGRGREGGREREREREKKRACFRFTFTWLIFSLQVFFCAWMFSVRHVIARHVWHYPCTEPLKMFFEVREREREGERERGREGEREREVSCKQVWEFWRPFLSRIHGGVTCSHWAAVLHVPSLPTSTCTHTHLLHTLAP